MDDLFLSVSVTVRSSNGAAFMGQGKNLTEGLAVLDSYILELPIELAAAYRRALQGPPVVAEITSGGRWWKPWTWARITVQWTII